MGHSSLADVVTAVARAACSISQPAVTFSVYAAALNYIMLSGDGGTKVWRTCRAQRYNAINQSGDVLVVSRYGHVSDVKARILALASSLASASSIWPRPGHDLVHLASKMCYPMQNNIGCIHFVVVSLQHSLQRRG